MSLRMSGYRRAGAMSSATPWRLPRGATDRLHLTLSA